ncbi:pericentriolar material 1 protein isoform X3 [Hyla sarda]|uniref:pericentriolar material 1 protein isoform X3 n=1 Tax=Hyla sarda TaxID=327740 RepID=UPI0024C25D9B|nr:pericentriolar material 1 protein isoform X3 [Hyla sarda]
MATGGGPPEETITDQDLPNWSHESLEDRLNNMEWSGQKKGNRSSEKNKKTFGVDYESRLTNDISPGSSPGVGRRRTRTPHTYPHTRYMSQMSVPEQAELEKLRQKINFGDLDQRSIGSDSQGRATAANNKRQLSENRKSFNFLSLQLNTNKDKAASSSPPKRETSGPSLPKEYLTSPLSKELLQNYQAALGEDGLDEPAIDSSQVVSRFAQFHSLITKGKDDFVKKNIRSATVEHLSNIIEYLRDQENCCLKCHQKKLASRDEEDAWTVDSAVGSASVAESTSLNIDVQSEGSDTTEVSVSRPRIEDNLGSSGSQMKCSHPDIKTSPKSKRPAMNNREMKSSSTCVLQPGLQFKPVDSQQEAKEELKNMKKQHALLTRMLQQQEQLRALKGRQAALLALQHKAEQAIAVMDESVVTETTGSVSGLSLTSELNEELNDLIQRFHNQLHDVQSPPVPDNRRQAESLSLTRAVSQSLNSSISEAASEERGPLFSKVGVLLEKKQKMDSILGELHTLQDHHLNNTIVGSSGSPQRVMDQRSMGSTSSANQVTDKRPSNSPARGAACSSASMNNSEDEENQNPTEKLKKLKEVRKRLNELRDLVRYYEQTSDMITDAVNENTKDEEEETEDSWFESDQEVNQPVTNNRNPQRMSSWGPVNSITNSQCAVNNRDERSCNTDCEINNRSDANLRSFNISSALDCLYNRDTEEKREDRIEGLDDDGADEDPLSAASLSSRSSVTEDDQNDDDFEEKFNRLIAAKQKLRQLQDLVAMYGDDTESETTAERPTAAAHYEEANANQQPNNTRPSGSKAQKDVALKEQAREKFYETKLQQQQEELKQLQEERKKLIEIQEKIQTLRKACPDLQLSIAGTSRRMPTAASTPEVNDINPVVLPSMPDPEDSSSADNEVWSEIRRHQILREDLRQRRKQLESLMAEHQRRQGIAETTSAGSLRSDDSEAHSLQHQSRTEKTMATWGGSTQCALDDEDEDSISEVNQAEEEEEEEEEEQENTFRENAPYPPSSINQSAFSGKTNKHGWKNKRSYSIDGNYRPSPKTRQQQNISMRRQENVQWVSELSQVEEKEHWQEQINQLKKQIEFSTNICQTLMRDQQSLSYLLQSLFTNPYNVMPSSMGTPQVHLIMHQLNQCYTQLNWQQNNVLRLKQMLNDMCQQQEHIHQSSQQRQERASSVPPPSSPNMFNNFSFLPPPMNVFNIPPFGNFPNMMPGVNFNSVFQPGIGDLTRNSASQPDIPLQPHDPNTSGKTEYMAFPKPFESNSSSTADKQRTSPKAADEGEHSRGHRLENQNEDKVKTSPFMDPGLSVFGNSVKQMRQYDEESVESLSSMPDPGDPTTVTKTYKSRKASAQASLASKDKTPKTKNKKRKIFHHKITDLKSGSASSAAKLMESSNKHAQTEEVTEANPSCDHIERLRKDNKTADISSEAGSDFSMFEALRDTIYSEVATLISQNESRPHFLIELFHELQLLNTDYLRQKALFALQDIVTRCVTDATDMKLDNTKPVESIGWMASNSELTPSESLATTDDEMFTKNSTGPAFNEGEQNDGDNLSNLSTSSNFEPFATDDLGNTVIHLDQALARMREYERMKLESENNLAADSCNNLNNAATNLEGSDEGGHSRLFNEDGSGVPCPRIDTQQLDRQIKAIMKEVIPFLKTHLQGSLEKQQEHMEEVCSPHLLTSIRRMVLTLTQQNDESKEFVKFFHKQLGSILQDSLAKFSNKKLKDCGEDLLVEISEVLFNELAFFRLMQDLDNTSSSVQSRSQQNADADVLQSFSKEAKKIFVSEENTETGEIDDEDKDKDETETLPKTQTKNIDVSEAHSGRSDISEEEDGNDMPVSISLSKAETQALTNYGSGEDENEEEEENYEFEAGPVDVQTSLEANNENTEEHEKEAVLNNSPKEMANEHTEMLKQETGNDQTSEEDQKSLSADVLSLNTSTPLLLNKESEMSSSVDVDTKSSLASAESSGPGSPATDSPVLVNEYQETGSGNLSQKSDEDDFVKVEDLPLKLTLPKTELMAEMEKEELKNNLCDEILNLNGQENGADDLAGDALLLKEPDSFGSSSA